jgi:hypothetical protein
MKLAITLPLLIAAVSAENAVKTQSANEIEVRFRLFVDARAVSVLGVPGQVLLTVLLIDHISCPP